MLLPHSTPHDIFLNLERESPSIPWYIRLWAATVRRAAVDWVLYANHENPRIRKQGMDAHTWIFVDDNSGYIASFVNVCDMLGLEPELVRARIRRLSEEEVRRMRCMEFGDDI